MRKNKATKEIPPMKQHKFFFEIQPSPIFFENNIKKNKYKNRIIRVGYDRTQQAIAIPATNKSMDFFVFKKFIKAQINTKKKIYAQKQNSND